jgi:hypothetical protein
MSKKEDQTVNYKTWDKEAYLLKLLNNRSRDFFIAKSKHYLNIATSILLLSLILVIVNGYVIFQNTKEKSYYITGIDGKVYQIKVDEAKYQKINRAINEYYAKKNAMQNNKGN